MKALSRRLMLLVAAIIGAGLVGPFSVFSVAGDLSASFYHLERDSDEALVCLNNIYDTTFMLTTSKRFAFYSPSENVWYTLKFEEIIKDADKFKEHLLSMSLVEDDSPFGYFAILTYNGPFDDGSYRVRRFTVEEGGWVFKDEFSFKQLPFAIWTQGYPAQIKFKRLKGGDVLMYGLFSPQESLKYVEIPSSEKIESMEEDFEPYFSDLLNGEGTRVKDIVGADNTKYKDVDISFVSGSGSSESLGDKLREETGMDVRFRTLDAKNHYCEYTQQSDGSFRQTDFARMPYDPHPTDNTPNTADDGYVNNNNGDDNGGNSGGNDNNGDDNGGNSGGNDNNGDDNGGGHDGDGGGSGRGHGGGRPIPD